MERFKEVEGILGSKNVESILDQIRNGQLTEDDLKQIALVMGNGVHGVFVQNKDKYGTRLTLLMKILLDAWYNNHKPYKTNTKGLEKLIDILEHKLVGLNYLAHSIREQVTSKYSIVWKVLTFLFL
jgi:hypothetical protein